MADDFAPPPALEPLPSASPSRAEFRSQPRPQSRKRRALPRWAWVAIASGMVAIGAGVAAAVVADARAAALEPASPGTTGRLHSTQVVSGMCLEAVAPRNGPAGRVTVVGCDSPHSAEVVASYAYESGEWPGSADADHGVLSFCAAQLGPSGPLAGQLGDRTWVAWAPTERTWAAGDHTGLCIVTGARPWTGRVTHARVTQST